MRITIDNLKELCPIEEQNLMESLLIDLVEFNQMLENIGMERLKVYFDRQTTHTEYSPEWTEPCPDYYGFYSIRFENDDSGEMVGDYMTINDLDNAMLLLVNFIEH